MIIYLYKINRMIRITSLQKYAYIDHSNLDFDFSIYNQLTQQIHYWRPVVIDETKIKYGDRQVLDDRIILMNTPYTPDEYDDFTSHFPEPFIKHKPYDIDPDPERDFDLIYHLKENPDTVPESKQMTELVTLLKIAKKQELDQLKREKQDLLELKYPTGKPQLFRALSETVDAENTELQTFSKNYPSRASIKTDIPKENMITYIIEAHGKMISPIREIHTSMLSDKPFVINKLGMLGMIAYSSIFQNMCTKFNITDIIRETFTIFPDHELTPDPYPLLTWYSNLKCCVTDTIIYSLDESGPITLSLLLEQLCAYHDLIYPDKGIYLHCSMCSGTDDIIEYVLWESKIYHELVYKQYKDQHISQVVDIKGYTDLYQNYIANHSFVLTRKNVKRLVFVLHQFNHLFHSGIKTFIYFYKSIIGIPINLNMSELLNYIIQSRLIVSVLEQISRNKYKDLSHSITHVITKYKALVALFNSWFDKVPKLFYKRKTNPDLLLSYQEQEHNMDFSYIDKLDVVDWTKEVFSLKTGIMLLGMVAGALAGGLLWVYGLTSYPVLNTFLSSILGGILGSKIKVKPVKPTLITQEEEMIQPYKKSNKRKKHKKHSKRK